MSNIVITFYPTDTPRLFMFHVNEDWSDCADAELIWSFTVLTFYIMTRVIFQNPVLALTFADRDKKNPNPYAGN